MRREGFWAGAGATVMAVVGSSCCWLPLLLLAMGAGATAVGSVTNTIERFRPLFALLAIGSLGAAVYFTYFRRAAAPASQSADACCVVQRQGEAKDATCSCCNQKGKRVPSRTVRALIREPLRGQVQEGSYVLCLNPGCAQVYTGQDGTRSFVKQDLAVRVGYKEQNAPHLVCYCFEHSVEDIESELRSSSKTTIPDRIKAEVQAQRCACDVKNPQGTCCLGNVNRAVKEVQDRIAGRTTVFPGAPAVQCAPPLAQESHDECCKLPRAPGAARTVQGLKKVNKVLLPFVGALILGMVFFPHRIFAFLVAKGKPTASTVDPGLKAVVVHVPGMT